MGPGMLVCVTLLILFFRIVKKKKIIKMATNVKEFGHIRPFDGSNFPTWKFGMDILLERSKLTEIVDGTSAKPAEVEK